MDNLPGPGPGRPKGSVNKTTRAAKEAISLAADELGGHERLVAWVKEDPANERLFWGTIYTKLVAASGSKDDPLHVEHGLSSLDAVYGQLQPTP